MFVYKWVQVQLEASRGSWNPLRGVEDSCEMHGVGAGNGSLDPLQEEGIKS